jgi:hypothetical protein
MPLQSISTIGEENDFKGIKMHSENEALWATMQRHGRTKKRNKDTDNFLSR